MPDLKDKIISKIEDQKPINPSYFTILDVSRVIALCVLVFLGGFAVAYLFWDWWFWITDVNTLGYEDVLSILSGSIPLAFILITLFIIAEYGIYRQTDWPMVEKRGYLVLVSSALILFIGTGSWLFIQSSKPVQKSLNELDKQLVILPLKPTGPTRILRENKQKGLFVGRIVEIKEIEDSAECVIVIENRLSTEEFIITKEMLDDLEVRDRVRLYFDPGSKYVKSISKVKVAIHIKPMVEIQVKPEFTFEKSF